MWAMGVILLEMFLGRWPFKNLGDFKKSNFENIPAFAPDIARYCIEGLLKLDSSSRLTCETIKLKLQVRSLL